MILELKTELAVREPASDVLLNTPESAAPFLEDLRHLAQEAFVVLTLNTKNRVIRRHLVSLGTVNSTLVSARECFRPAIRDGAASVIFGHSHPSGDPSPSAQDIRITKKLIEAGKLIEIPVLDHLIVGDGPPLSLKETGLLNSTNQGEPMKTKDTIEMTRSNRTDFERMKSVLACASKDQTRYPITKVLVKKESAGVTITATDGRRLRIDHFMIEASAGIYDIKVNSGSGIFLMRNKERLTFPKTDQVIPSMDPMDAYALEGTGGRFVLWASSALGCLINPELIALGDHEKVTLYIQRRTPHLFPAVMKNNQTTFVLMPLTIKEPWMQQLEEIRTAKAA